jgi:hypothetical protein
MTYSMVYIFTTIKELTVPYTKTIELYTLNA